MSFREKFLLSQEAVCLFAEVVKDPNPIHQDNEVAKQMGLEGAIAHGMFVYCYLLQRLDQWMALQKQEGVDWDLVGTKCRFHEPALIGKTFESLLELSDLSAETAKMNLTFLSEDGKRLTHVVAQLRRR